jgi:S-formylglutathione hydrolase FrmB
MKKIIPLFCIVILLTLQTFAASVDTISIYSKKMQKEFKCVVIKPDSYDHSNTAKDGFPVVYLLHGYSGWYANWLLRVPELNEYADTYQLLIVCPDGGYNSWYLDSPIDSSVGFETYVGKEVPEYIDSHYNTIKDRKKRAITGLSMGGHGGLFLGFRHAATFGACGSMSGGVDLRPFASNWELKEKIGDTITNADNWKNYSVMNVIEKYPQDSVSIIFDCGTEDFFYTVNYALHEKMVALKIPHEYIERPGKHDWAYWGMSVKQQLLFFSNYFHNKK